jgi:DNA gyrase/topoisomerase IV subunit A
MVKKQKQATPPAAVVEQSAVDFVRRAMKHYGDEVIQNRALPRLEDGLKPIQRLLLWSCVDLSTSKFIKSAKITGHCIASYSPHGEIAAYGSLVGMVNERHPLVEGQGNFGGATTEAASARYTESRIHPLARRLITDLPDMSVVPYEKNYDDTRDQPRYLPGILPMLLLNSSTGIAMAITSKFPGFSILEVAAAVLEYLSSGNEKKASRHIKAPDGNACTLLSSKEEVAELLAAGCGQLLYECKHHLDKKGDRKLIVITGYTPEFSVSGFLSKCGELQDAGVIEATRNETSGANGDRIVIEYRSDEAYEKVRKLLRKKISYRMNCLYEDGDSLVPKQVGVADVIRDWVAVRRKTVAAMLRASLARQDEDIKREAAKLKACVNLDAVFAALQSDGDFRQNLQKLAGLDEFEAGIVCEMRVEALKKASAQALGNKITDMQTARASTETDLNNIDAYLIRQIKAFMTWLKNEYPDLLLRKTVWET